MARILMLLTQFSARDAAPDPPHQLADALVAEGHSVTAIVVPWQQSQARVEQYRENDRLRVIRVPPLKPGRGGRVSGLLRRWILSSWRARRHAETLVGDDQFDLIYTTSPAVAMNSLIRWALRRSPGARSYLYIVDFFPFHQRAIGLIPGGLVFGLARWSENALVRMFDVVACMSPRNLDYLRANYTLGPNQQTELLRLSTGIEPERSIDRDAVRARHGVPPDKLVVIFGGQITEGRGIEQIIEVAGLARDTLPDLHFVLAGNGRLTHLVETYVSGGGTNLTLRPSMARDVYLDLAAACDIGLVVTVPVAGIPTFPSKTLDYLQASLPVVAAVEADTDFRDFVDEHRFGLVVQAGDTPALLEALAQLLHHDDERRGMARAGRRTLHEVFDVRKTAKKITSHIKSGDSDVVHDAHL